MNSLFIYRWSDVLHVLSLALVYAVVAVCVLSFFSANNVVSIFWPPGGIGLAALILGGMKYSPGIFLGALVGNFLAGRAHWKLPWSSRWAIRWKRWQVAGYLAESKVSIAL